LINKGTYIKTIEASIIWEHTNRDSYLKEDYKGYIPYSLELIKLRLENMEEFAIASRKVNKEIEDKTKKVTEQYKKAVVDYDKRTAKNITKFYTDDIINVTFSSKVHNYISSLKRIKKSQKKKRRLNFEKFKKQYSTANEEDKVEIITKYKSIRKSNKERIEEVKQSYKNKPKEWKKTISLEELRKELYKNGFTIKNWKGEDVPYVVYKRSSAKARTGECLFIRKELAETMTSWSR